jgi:hypothetical protein
MPALRRFDRPDCCFGAGHDSTGAGNCFTGYRWWRDTADHGERGACSTFAAVKAERRRRKSLQP